MSELEKSLLLLQTIDAYTWVKSLVIVTIGYFLAKFVSNRGIRLLQKHLNKSQQVLLTRTLFSIIFFLFLATAFQQLGFHITALLSAAGIITVAIGFAAQTSISNLISGLFLLTEHSIRIGDLIQVNNTIGEVLHIDLFSAKLRTVDGILVRIPNEILVKSQIHNINHFHKRRLDLTLQVAYGQNLDHIEKLLFQAIAINPLKVETPVPLMQYTKFTKEGVELLLMSWMHTVDYGAYSHQLIKDINRLFSENQVTMALAHIVVANSPTLNNTRKE